MYIKHNHNVLEGAVVVILVTLFGLFPLLSRIWITLLGGTTVGLTMLSLLKGWKKSIPLGVFCSVCILSVIAKIPFSQIWLGLALLVYFILCKQSDSLKDHLSWFKLGHLNRDLFLPALGFVFLASSALILWFFVTNPDIDDLIDQFLPKVNCVFLIAGGVFFSVINAAVEEGAYRGVVMHSLDQTVGTQKGVSMAFQATAFATLHINGFPRGWQGVLLAFFFGIFMGILRRKSDGILICWIAHVCVDLVIIGILIRYMH